jgi:hypothetical protein
VTITRTSTGYEGRINGARFTVTVANGTTTIAGHPGHYLNEGEMRLITREVKKREAEPLLNQAKDTKAHLT